jgi:hypothetical protein
MPRILKIKTEGGNVWVQIEQSDILASHSPIYLWTKEEAEEHRRQAIRSFLFDLGNKFIEQNYPIPTENSDGD